MPCRSIFGDLTDKNSELRKASAAAIGKLREPAAVVLEQLAKRNELSPAVVPELRSILRRTGAHFDLAGAGPVSHSRVGRVSPRLSRLTSRPAFRRSRAAST